MLPYDRCDSTSVLVLLVVTDILSVLMMYWVIQIESSDGGDQVRLTELSLSAVTDNPIGGPSDVISENTMIICQY